MLKCKITVAAAFLAVLSCSEPHSTEPVSGRPYESQSVPHCENDRVRVVDEYLSANPGWRPVSIADLPADDRRLWNSRRQNLCPGTASATVGPGIVAHALVLISRANGRLLQKFVVIVERNGRLEVSELIAATEVLSPLVVWSIEPGEYQDMETEENLNLAYESFILEKLEATSSQYYWADGAFHRILATE